MPDVLPLRAGVVALREMVPVDDAVHPLFAGVIVKPGGEIVCCYRLAPLQG